MSERNLDFDTIVPRKGTDCLKYDFAVRRGMPEDVLPLWVADMDFKTSSYIEDAVIERTKHAIFGYSEVQGEYFEAVAGWMKRHHNWDIDIRWLIKTPGVVFALAMAVKAFTSVGDKVLIQQPVYYPFSEVIADNDRVIVSNDLVLGEDLRYHIDFEDLEQKIVDNDIKLFLLCNPHNPSRRVFTVDELTRIGEICLRHNVLVVSDEIHNDFVFEGEHTVFASISKEFADISIICTSPSKTFNLAGMLISNILIPNATIRRRFRHEVAAAGMSQLGTLGLVAAQTAYEKGDVWYEAMLSYVKSNIDYVRVFTKNELPGVKFIEGEGTFLVWLDFRETGLSFEEIDRRIIHEAKLWLDSGRVFGEIGNGFQRINVAAPRKTIEECMRRIKAIL
ncbi:MAG: pyridoxal phosphate-dependent aminotransferase [Saccharofermentans sp.]|nr:pyridoxal phosphate-dependent aminotransferase [Saccharofermentans sp.]